MIKKAKMTITPKRNHDSFWANWEDQHKDCPDEQFLNGCENLLDDFKQLDNYEK